ncbi:hypothetical protein MAN88_22290 [Microcystis aeruginosa]|nr:hypothetical protein MAN88_22290 [Microcystis aeruginosa]
MSIVFDLERTNQLSLLPDKDLVDLCSPIEPYQVTKSLIILIEIIEANNDATLEELSDLLYEKTQVKVSRATLGRLTQKLNYSFKKKPYTRRKKKVTGYSKKEWNTGQKFGKLRHQN